MQMLVNLAFGAAVAGLSLGPAGWADLAEMEAKASHAVMAIAGFEGTTSQLDAAAARARAALPQMPTRAH
ncbi:MAG TPA: hypothetical protein VMF58_09090 [Rhizomicrobium sp.]|nr:hypothetical protein [Rhizomicrobium sp.]